MGLLDGILGGFVGGQMATVVNQLIEKHGGLAGIVSQLEKGGLGETVRSWVGTGPNQDVSGDQLHQALGGDLVAQLAGKFGMSPQDLTQALSQVLPQAIDKMTPNGQLPRA